MSHDERLRDAMQPDWSELRERRVIGRALRQLEQTPPVNRMRVWVPGGIAVAACLALGVGAGIHWHHRNGPLSGKDPWAQVARLSLLEGSTALVGTGAELKVEERQAQRVVVRQSSGRVEYDVRHDPQREFFVHAGNVLIRDLGTRFAIEFLGPTLEISVQQGRVEVLEDNRRQELETGESVRIQLGANGSPALPVASAQMPPPAEAAPEQDGPSGDSWSADRDSGSPDVQTPTSVPSGVVPSDAPELLLARSDTARAAGRLQDSASALRQFVRLYPNDHRAAGAWFALAKVEGLRGSPAAAAAAYARAAAGMGARGTLAEDAIAEEAEAWLKSGQPSRARSVARSYLERYPHGVHATRMNTLLE